MNVIKGKVTVLMPVYNGEKFLRLAIDSILSQTYRDFELFILLEYGSNEESRAIIHSCHDERIVVLENDEKLGLAASLNKGIQHATGEFIARMDADDISYPKRLEEEVKYLKKHTEIDLCGTWAIKKRVLWKNSFTPEQVRFTSFFNSPFFHPTVMWRNEVFKEHNLEYKLGITAEDYELWMRALDCVKGANITKPLLYYRVHANNRSTYYRQELVDEDFEIKKEYWERNGMTYSKQKNENGLLDKYVWNEQQMLELTEHMPDFSGRNRIVEKKMLDAYMAGERMSIFEIYRRYTKIFINLYQNKFIAKAEILCYCVYRVMKRKSRLMLQSIGIFK